MTLPSLFPEDGQPMALERDLARQGWTLIAGVDEVGRGALAGPVVAAAIVLKPSAVALRGKVRDSKKLTPKARENLFPLILEHAASFGVGMVSAPDIDRGNILEASLWAMKLAVEKLEPAPSICLIDGNQPPPLELPHRTIPKGDDRVFSISAASIVAKVTRDRLMVDQAQTFPAYGFERNKGYGSAAHLEALAKVGPCSLHRHSFAPIKSP